jgi:hypothetical protein
MIWVFIIALSMVAIWVASWIFDHQDYYSGPLYWLASLLTFVFSH